MELVPLDPELHVIDMALCEVPHLVLRPGRLYRFYAVDGCSACAELAAEAFNAYGEVPEVHPRLLPPAV